MNIDVTQSVKDWYGKPLQIEDGYTQGENGEVVPKYRPLLLREVLLVVANHDQPDQKVAMDMHRLGIRVAMCDSVDITIEEAAQIKAHVTQYYKPMVVGQVIDILEMRNLTVEAADKVE